MEHDRIAGPVPTLLALASFLFALWILANAAGDFLK